MTKNAQSGHEASSDRMFRRTATVDPHAGLGAIARITRMAFRYPVRAGLALAATVAAVLMQLSIPVILGRAVDQTQAVAAAKAEPETLYRIALLLFLASVARGIFTLIQNYTAESVGHSLARDIRNAVYGKIQSLPFSFHDPNGNQRRLEGGLRYPVDRRRSNVSLAILSGKHIEPIRNHPQRCFLRVIVHDCRTSMPPLACQ